MSWAGRASYGAPSIIAGRKPAGELFPVPIPPGGVHANLLRGLLGHPVNLRGFAGSEERLDVLRRFRRREGLRNFHEPADEEPGRSVSAVELVPVLLFEGAPPGPAPPPCGRGDG